MTSLYADLKAEYGSPVVELERICGRLWGLSVKEAKYRAGRNRLPVPAYKGASQKSSWFVSVKLLAAYLEERERQALDAWTRSQPMAPVPIAAAARPIGSRVKAAPVA